MEKDMGAFALRCRYLRCMLSWLEISVEVLVRKTLPVTAYRTDKLSNGKEGGSENLTQHSSDGQSTQVDFPRQECQWCVLLLSQTLRSNPQGTGHRQNKKWALLQGDWSATEARTHTDPLAVCPLAPYSRSACTERLQAHSEYSYDFWSFAFYFIWAH